MSCTWFRKFVTHEILVSFSLFTHIQTQSRSVSINCAHLHPQFGAPTPADTLKALQDEEEFGEIDVNLEEYKRRRDEARRSPYPSVIVEVQSTPPPEYSAPTKLSMGMDGSHGITSEDIASLERAFSMGVASKALYKGTSGDDYFYDALGDVS